MLPWVSPGNRLASRMGRTAVLLLILLFDWKVFAERGRGKSPIIAGTPDSKKDDNSLRGRGVDIVTFSFLLYQSHIFLYIFSVLLV